MKKLINPLLLIIFSTSVYAYCCTNPLSFGDVCFDTNLTQDVAEKMCCQESEYYGASPRFPKSQEDCLENFFSETCNEEACLPGCCFDLTINTCFSDTPQSQCNGIFSTKLNGSCETDGYYAFPVCEEGCCCTTEGFSLTTSRGCSGDFTKSVSSEQICQYICQANYCVDGCQDEKPFFCENDRIKKDCTGGDGIVGNGNDCGCPIGEQCLSSGNCEKPIPIQSFNSEKTCTEEGYLWCETENKCVNSCLDCSNSVEEKNSCVDSCKNVECGENSQCFEGECICDEGFYDEVCRAYNMQIDYEKDGCFREEPCTPKSSNSFWWVSLIVLVVILFIIFKIGKGRKKVEEKTEEPYFGNYYQQGFQKPPF